MSDWALCRCRVGAVLRCGGAFGHASTRAAVSCSQDHGWPWVSSGTDTSRLLRLRGRAGARQDTNTDNCASDYYENETTYCVCMVYGLYLQ